MASWVGISNTVIAAGKEIKAITIRQLRDNITAMAEGATGAPKILGGAISTALPVAVSATSTEAENTQRLLVSRYTNADGLEYGFLGTDGSVPPDMYAAQPAINVAATHDDSTFFATNTTITAYSLVGTFMVITGAVGFQGRDVKIEQIRGATTIFSQSYSDSDLARPLLNVQSGDVIIVGIEQNSDNCTVELAWRPVFKVAYPVAVI